MALIIITLVLNKFGTIRFLRILLRCRMIFQYSLEDGKKEHQNTPGPSGSFNAEGGGNIK